MPADVLAPPRGEKPRPAHDARVPAPPPRGRRQPRWRGPPGDPAWARPALLALLAATAVLYLWGLSASGWANSYYAAAVQAGTKSWRAFLFGSLDSANFITVDKAPAFLWPMELSARVFGVSSWSILVPQALEGVATVGLLYATIRRWFGAPAALLAGAVLATTPVAALIFRYNNPDALLVLILTAGAYALTRAVEGGSSRWLALAFGLVGLGFLAKMLQTLLVVPPFALTYLVASPPRLARRIRQLLGAGVVMVATAGWWIVAVELTPGASRPYIGGSQNNSLWNLILGYNGFGRLTGNETGSVGGGGQGGSRWGATGITRLFNASFGGQIAWLVPAALVLVCAGVALCWRRSRTDRTRAALVLWGGWLLITGVVFSLGRGIIHPYYSVALAPAIGAVVGIGAVTLWRRRRAASWYTLCVVFAVTIAWSTILLERTPTWLPWLRVVLIVAGVGLTGALLLWPSISKRPPRAIAVAAVVVGLLGPGAYTLATVATAHTGAIPSAGPATMGLGFGGPAAGGVGPPGRTPGGGGPPGGLLNGTSVSTQLRAFLRRHRTNFSWVAATVDANNAASYQLAVGEPVMAIGGFNGTDPAPTLAQFQRDVAAHRVHYFIGSDRGGFGGGQTQPGTTAASQITAWVGNHFAAQTIGGATVYDLTGSSFRGP